MAEVLIPWTIPDQEAGMVVGLIWDDALNQILGFYGQNSSEDQITLKVQVGAAVRSITLAPFETVERRVNLPTAQRIAMRLATGTDRPWQQQRGFVPSYTSLTVERVFTTPRGGSPSILSAAYTEFLSSATTSHSTPMPATVDPNDGLLVGFFIDITANLWASGFSKITDATNTDRGFTFGKVAVGNEDGTNIDFLSTSAALGIAHVYRIDAGTWGECVAAFEGTTATGTSATPDPPSITPSWGSQDITVVAFGMKISGTVTSAPTNYTDLVNGAAGANMGSARRSLTASSEDPGTFGGATSDAWNAHTIAIAPEDADLTNSGKPYFVGCGTSVAGAAGITATLPGGILDDDLLILVLESEGEDTNAETIPSGWDTNGGANSVASGTGGAAADVRITWGFDIYASGSPPTLTVADAGDHVTAVIYAFRNVDTSTPLDAVQSSSNGTAGTSMSITGVNSTQDNCLVFQVSAAGDDSGVASPVTMSGTNANLAAPAIRHAGGGATTAGSDGSIQAFYGGLAATGASGTATGTFSASVEQANYTIIIAPPGATPATVTPGVIARSVAIPAVTVKGAAVTAPGVIARSATVETVTVKGGAKTTPAATAAPAAIPSATAKGAAKTTPDAIARATVIPQVTAFDSGSPGLVTPDVIARTATVGAVTVKGGSVTTPGVIGLSVVVPQVVLKGGAVVAPALIDLDVVIGQVSTLAGGTTVTPDAIARAATIPAVTVSAAAKAQVEAIARSATVPQVTIKGQAKTLPAVTAAVSAVPQVTVKGGSTTTPDVIARTVVLPGVVVKGAAEVEPGVVVIVVSIPQVSATETAGSGTYQEGGLFLVVQSGGATTDGSSGGIGLSHVSGGLQVGSQG